MSTLSRKILYKTYRSLGVDKLLKIKAGPLKNSRWNVAIPDSRYLLGNYEPQLAEIVKNEVSAGKRFVDIGANAGYFSLIAANSGEKNTMHLAVEPFPENISLLNHHLDANQIENVTVLQLAIADKNGEIEFSDSGNLAANTYKKESSMFKGKSIKVNSRDLNTFAKEHDLDGNCFIKIDVEGAELDVLNGGLDYLKEFHPTLLLATHDCHVEGIKDQCLAIISSIGYEYEEVEDEKIQGQEDFLCTYSSTL